MAATDSTVQARAKARYVRSAPRKAQLVVDQIRGLPVPEARTVLAFSKRAVARDVEKVLWSAVANAEANHDLIGDELFVQEAYVGQGPTLKRWRARARGRAGSIHKRSSHIVIGLAELDEELRALRVSDEESDEGAIAEEVDADASTDEAAVESEETAADVDVDGGEATETDDDGEAAEDIASETEAADSTDDAPQAAEPYEGYVDHTAKQVVAVVGELSDEQIDAVAAQDDRVTVLRAIEKERATRSEAANGEQEN
jgi:large subunit ribosomal protein L22